MKISRNAFILLVLFVIECAVSQTLSPFSPDTVQPQSLYTSAVALQGKALYDSAIVLFDSAASIFKQAHRLREWIHCLNGTAECYRLKGKFDNALHAEELDRPTEQSLIEQEPAAAAQRYIVLGSIYRDKGMYDTTLVLVRSALSIHHSHAPADTMLEWDIYSLLAGTFFDLGDHDSALAYNNQALQLFATPDDEEKVKISATNNSIANIYETRGEYTKALDFFIRSLDIRRAALGENHPDIANLYNNVASIYFRTGDYDRSLEYYFKSLSIMDKIFPPDHPSFGIRYNNIAMSYRGKGDFDKALEYGNKSRDIFVKKFGTDHPNVGGVTNNIGRIYSDMKQYGRALEEYQQALSSWKAKLGGKHPYVLQAYFNVGEDYGHLGKVDSAKELLKLSLSLRREILGEKNVKTAQSFNGLGRVYLDCHQPDSALFCFQRSLAALIDDFSDTTDYTNPGSFNSPSDLDVLVALLGKAEAYKERFAKTRHTADLISTVHTYERAADLVETVRQGFFSEGSKLEFSQTAFSVYGDGIAAALDLFQITHDPIYKSTAFEMAERSKAGILWDAIAELDTKHFGGIPDTLLDLESKIKTDLVYFETQIQKEKQKGSKANGRNISAWENDVFKLHRKYADLIGFFQKNFPAYHSLKLDTSHVSLNEIQSGLPDNKTVLIEYFVGIRTVTIFAVTKKNCTIRSVALKPSIDDLVKRFRNSIQNIDNAEYCETAFSLYKQLIHPVQKDLNGARSLVIVPDGILTYLPFEALLTKKIDASSTANFSHLPYLLSRFEIIYRVSARSEKKKYSRSTRSNNNGFVGFAPVFADRPDHSKEMLSAASKSRVTRSRTVDGERLAELKETEQETRNITALFQSKRLPAKIFLNSEAQESTMKSSGVERFRFLHIATHAVINEEKPGLSGIVFASPEKGSLEDGILYSGEVYNLQLNADLVVLSACETGLGTIVKGEGLLGFTRGFLYAGAENLIVSLWQVGDKSTAELMVHFYRNILKGQPYSRALRNAKLAMISGGKYAHPIEWSPFILTGK